MLVGRRRITERVALILKIWVTMGGERMSLILKI